MEGRAKRHAEAGMDDFEHYFTSCGELAEENHTLKEMLREGDEVIKLAFKYANYRETTQQDLEAYQWTIKAHNLRLRVRAASGKEK